MSVIRKGLLLTALMISPALAEEIAILLPQTGPTGLDATPGYGLLQLSCINTFSPLNEHIPAL